MTINFTKHLALGAVVAACTFGNGANAAEERSYLLATASTGGTYYPVGVALSTLVKVKLQPKQKIGMSAINSAGSGENIKLLRENEAQFAILQGLYGHYAKTGTGPIANDGPQKDLRSVSMLWQNVEHFAVLKDYAKTGTVDDLANVKGKAMAMGKKNSGTIGSNRTILKHLGIDMDKDYSLMYGGYGPSVDALQNGQVVGFGIPAGAPAGAVTKAMANMSDRMAILDLSDAQAEKADGGMGLWTRFVIPAGTYPNQAKDINTIAQPNFLAVRHDVDEDAVYRITKATYENLAFLNAIHKATKAMAIEKAIAGLPLPLHPGALKYYQEVGIKVPAHLIAK
ncbi:TAXI family TRAP transporter solute-binding subunit [Magnetospira sp. QH-2]|uniref:TAXI family TRAP transporter solute-binding subunit n=1 Tax=Magnetospira sp. (strain QH-2) TaxID=1288970 RepID=UPI0003E81BED|nr:TAXI family TRAP transporter solute-binding subunit [Magnetospira sp. QH-2]CCQ73179.1 Putative TRAP transporter solute receptor, TAXI family [Magnetospira sp. QH-2]